MCDFPRKARLGSARSNKNPDQVNQVIHGRASFQLSSLYQDGDDTHRQFDSARLLLKSLQESLGDSRLFQFNSLSTSTIKTLAESV
jgi:hypothetical protein